MNFIKTFVIILIFSGVLLSQELKTQKDSISYAFGMDIGNNLSSNPAYGDFIDIDVLAMGMVDSYKGASKLSQEDYQKLIRTFQTMLQEEQAKAAEAAKVDQMAFLEENAKRPEVKTTPSGLQYEVLREGTGKMPAATQTVKVHYTGMLIDGTVFDSSVQRGEPIEFALNRVIPGWTEGLQLMKEGAKYKLFIPSELGYGDKGAGANIPGGATLIFEVELLEVK